MKKLNKHTNSEVPFQGQKTTKAIHSARPSTDASAWNSTPMNSLLRLQTIKNNPSLHIMDYNGAVSARQHITSVRLQSNSPREQSIETPTSATVKKRIKFKRTVSKKDQKDRPQSHVSLNEYQLDPSSLFTGQPKKSAQKNLPPETRQLIIEEYIFNSHNPAPIKKNLDLLWHQTLNEQTYNHHLEETYSEPKVVTLLEKFRSNPTEQSPMLTPRNIKAMSLKMHINVSGPGSGPVASAGAGGHEENNTLNRPPSPKIRRLTEFFEIPNKKIDENITPRGIENVQAFRNLETLSYFLRDFLKIIQHTFKAKDEINNEQRELHNFILTFAKEIEFAEKIPTKEANKERLTTFQSLIESRLNDVFTKQELLIEQIQKIQSFDPGLESGEDKPQLEILNVKTNFELNIANICLSPTHTNQRRTSNTMGLADNMDSIKEEVHQLQSERRQLHEKKFKRTLPEHVKKEYLDQFDSSAKQSNNARPSTAYGTTAKLSDVPTDNLQDYRELVSNLAMLPRLQTQASTHTANDPSRFKKSVTISLQPKENGSALIKREATIGDLPSSALKKSAQENVKLFSTLSIHEDETTEEDDPELTEERQTHKEMQIFFTSGLEQLESQFTKSLKEFKAFNKEIDAVKKRKEIQNIKMTQLRALLCIDGVNEICSRLIKEHDGKRKQFMERVKQYLQGLEKIVQANILKINSLKNLVATSTAKLYKIQKMKKKINPLDMRDKLYRKNYQEKYGKLKEQLIEEREAILFIANQIVVKLPNQKESDSVILIGFLEDLLNRSVKLLRGAHLMARIGQIEDEYNIRIDHCLDVLDRVNEHVERLTLKRQASIIFKAATIEDAEEAQKEEEILTAKLKIIRKELLYYKEYPFFTHLLTKPVDVLTKLLQRTRESQDLLKNALIRARGDVIQSYNVKVQSFVALKTKFDSFVQDDLISKKTFLDFDLHETNKAQVETFESELKTIQMDIKQYVTEHYPQSVAMLPKPEDQLEGIKALLYQIETLLKIINTGALFNSTHLGAVLNGATTYTLRDQFEMIRDNVAKEIREKELIGGSPQSSPQFQEMSNKILHLLVSLRLQIRHVLDYTDKCNRFISNFATEYYDNKEHFEDLFYQLLFELKNSYEEYLSFPLDETTKDHTVIVQINSRLKAIRQGEESLLQGLLRLFKLVKENQDFFEAEIEPIAVPCNYLNMLNKWAEKHHNAKIIRERMRPVYDKLIEYRVSEYILPNLRSIVEDFISQQEVILNSIEVCISFFEMGKQVSEKQIHALLTPKIRTDRSEYLDFLNDFEELLSNQKIKAEHSKGRVAPQFEYFLTTIIKVLHDLLEFLKIIDERYSAIPYELERVREMHPKDIIAIIRAASKSLQDLEDDFLQRTEDFERLLVKKCTIIQAIKEFVEQKIFKEVRIYKKLYNEVQQIQEFTETIKRDFIWGELTQFKYRQLKSLNVESLEKKRMICRNYIEHLSNYIDCDEIKGRQVVHDVLSRRKTVFVELDKILTLFRDFYEEGKDYWVQIDQLLLKSVDLSILSKDLNNLTTVLTKISKNVKQNYEAVTNLYVIEEEISLLSLKTIVVHDIFEFLQQSRKWSINLRKKIDGMNEFDSMTKSNFNGRVFLLREDWLLSIKEWLPALDEIPIGIKGIKLDYEGLTDRMEDFANFIKERYVEMKDKAVSNVRRYVTLLNMKFLNEWFFRAEKTEKVDKITPKLFRLAEKMREKRIPITNMTRRLAKYYVWLNEIIEAVEFLSNAENLNIAGFTSIENWDVITKYTNDHALSQWREVTKFLLERGHSIVMTIKEDSQWTKTIETNLNGPIFGKQIDMIKGYWLIYHN